MMLSFGKCSPTGGRRDQQSGPSKRSLVDCPPDYHYHQQQQQQLVSGLQKQSYTSVSQHNNRSRSPSKNSRPPAPPVRRVVRQPVLTYKNGNRHSKLPIPNGGSSPVKMSSDAVPPPDDLLDSLQESSVDSPGLTASAGAAVSFSAHGTGTGTGPGGKRNWAGGKGGLAVDGNCNIKEDSFPATEFSTVGGDIRMEPFDCDQGHHMFDSDQGHHTFDSGPGRHTFDSDQGHHTFDSDQGHHTDRFPQCHSDQHPSSEGQPPSDGIHYSDEPYHDVPEYAGNPADQHTEQGHHHQHHHHHPVTVPASVGVHHAGDREGDCREDGNKAFSQQSVGLSSTPKLSVTRSSSHSASDHSEVLLNFPPPPPVEEIEALNELNLSDQTSRSYTSEQETPSSHSARLLGDTPSFTSTSSTRFGSERESEGEGAASRESMLDFGSDVQYSDALKMLRESARRAKKGPSHGKITRASPGPAKPPRLSKSASVASSTADEERVSLGMSHSDANTSATSSMRSGGGDRDVMARRVEWHASVPRGNSTSDWSPTPALRNPQGASRPQSMPAHARTLPPGSGPLYRHHPTPVDRLSLDSGTSSDACLHRGGTSTTGHFVVVAIDFGTTFSGYAFSFTREPESIHVMRKWEGGDPGLLNQKTPTCLLLTPEGKLHSFGYCARDFYHDLDPEEAKKWLYFDKFKMVLHYSLELNESTTIPASNGKRFSALKVFSYALQFFREHALRELTDHCVVSVTSEDVKWVITVPAIWKQPAKQFMRRAAYMAGIAHEDYPEQLLIALEPEAASLYCRKLRMNQLVPDTPPPPRRLSVRRSIEEEETREEGVGLTNTHLDDHMGAGTRYMVVDCGGGTVDITVHQLDHKGGKLKELHRADGGPYGSVGVDLEFESLLNQIFGVEFIEQFKLKRPAGFVDLMIAFESRKRSANPYKDSPLNVSLPFSFIDYYKKTKGSTVESAVRKFGNPEIKWSQQGMLRLTQEAMKKLFVPTLTKIKMAVGTVLNSPHCKGVQYMFLVGGFAESPLLQMEIRKDFSSLLKVIIPQGVGLSILKGAVMFGLDPSAVHVRMSRLTYGVGVLNRFVPGRHPQSKRITRDGALWCTDVYDKFVIVDQPVTLGDAVVRSYAPARPGQKTSVINVYSSERPDAKFITDPGVVKCGTLTLDLSDLPPLSPPPVDASSPGSSSSGKGKKGSVSSASLREIQAKMIFGDTEVKVSALEVSSGRCMKATIDFLCNG